MWLLAIEEREEAHFFASHREFLTFYRELTGKGVRVDVLRDEAVTESRPGRVEILYRKPGALASAAFATLEIEIERDEQAWVELQFALVDLFKQGIDVDDGSFRELLDLGHELTGNGIRLPQIAPRARTERAAVTPLRLSVTLRCRAS